MQKTNNIMKKILLLATALILSLSNGFAQTDGGSCGPNLTWSFNNGTLIISGTGEMTSAPWLGSYQSLITTLIVGSEVTTIIENAFNGCSNLKTLILNDGTNTLNITGTQGWSIDTLYFGRNFNMSGRMGYQPAFGGLKHLTIGNSITNIPFAAFGYSTMESITIPNNVTTIGTNAFSYLNLKKLIINNGANILNINRQNEWGNNWSIDTLYLDRDIGSFTFSNSDLKHLIIGENVETIGDYMFAENSNLTSAIISNSVTSIGYGAFARTGLISIILPSSITSIAGQTFVQCVDLISVTIPNSVISIDRQAFMGCISLASLEIPSSVTSIGGQAFYECTGLTSITIHAEIPPVLGSNESIWVQPNSVFMDIPTNIPVYIPCLTRSLYNNAPGWSNFTNYIINGNTSDTTYLYKTICYGTTYVDSIFSLIGDTIIELGVGVYYVTLANADNCDSVVCLTISQFPFVPITDYWASFCLNGTYSDQNFTNLTAAGQHLITLQNVNGCDSIVRLNLQAIFPPVQELCMISVDRESHNEIVWKRQEVVTSYKIYRESIIVGQYELIATIPYDEPNSWIDTESNAKVRSYNYKISAIDLCGNESELSLPHKTMHLTINQGVGNSWNLIWSPYEGTQFSTYHIYRATNADSTMQMIGSMPSSNFTFSDFSAPAGHVYYMVEIVLNNPCEVSEAQSMPSRKSSSLFGSIRSNIATNAPATSINDIETYGILQIYPNPVTNKLYITNYEWQQGDIIELFDMNGKRVYSVRATGDTFTIDMSQYQQGNYILRIGSRVAKIVKQ